METERLISDYMQCAVCQTITTNSIQCFNGHVHCAVCLESMRQHAHTRPVACSCCRTRRGWAKTRIAVDLAMALGSKFPCGIDDCDEMLTIDKLEDHRACCPKKRFDCPLTCECESMALDKLVTHMHMHRRSVKHLLPNECLNIIVQAYDVPPRMHVLVRKDCIVCMRVALRMCRVDSACLEIHAGMIGYSGRPSNLRLHVTMYDLCSADVTQMSHEVAMTEGVEYLSGLPLLYCYGNFICESVPAEAEVTIHQHKWTREMFLNRCQDEVFDFEHEQDSHRLSTIVVQFEDIVREDRAH